MENNMNTGKVSIIKSTVGFDPAGKDYRMKCGALSLGKQTLSLICQQAECGTKEYQPGDIVPDVFPDSIVTVRVQDPITAEVYWITEASYNNYITECNECCTALPQLGALPSFAAAVGNTQSSISWGTVANATTYQLQMASNNRFSDAADIYNGSTSPYVKTGLTNGTTYWFRIRAKADGYQSSEWAVASVTPAP